MKQRKILYSLVIALFFMQPMVGMYSSDIEHAVHQQVKQAQIKDSRAKLIQKLHELRNLLNAQAHKLEDPAVLENVINAIKILIPLTAFALIGYKAYRQTFAGPKEQLVVTAPMKMPAPSVIAQVPMVPPSENIRKFFNEIENLTPSQVAYRYLDALLPQLEEKYGLDARKVQQHGFSLISAAIVAKNLSAVNKAELIHDLRAYGIEPTPLDRKRAHSLGETSVIQAIE